MSETKRKKKNRAEQGGLRKGESKHSAGGYQFRWTDEDGKRHSIHMQTLEELRKKEAEILQDVTEQIRPEAQKMTVNDLYQMWKSLKRGIKDNTMQNYLFLYTQYVAPRIGRYRIAYITKSEMKRFYNSLADEKGLSINTIDNIHTVLHQILDLAVDDCYMRRNPTDNVLKELKKVKEIKASGKRALTKKEQDIFLKYLRKSEQYCHWYPIFAVMIGTGMRVGEAIGLRWCDIDFDNGVIDINHTLIYYKHAVNGCYYNVHSPKTTKGIRKIPMLKSVREAFQEERRNQFEAGLRCHSVIDGYTDFVFLNRFGNPLNQGALNKALHRIVRDCNDDIMLKGGKNAVLLPNFSCHSLRHTFTTRLCEAGVNIKVIQDVLGHADVETTLNIYAEVTKDFRESEFAAFESVWSKESSI